MGKEDYISTDEKKTLLKLARKAIVEHFEKAGDVDTESLEEGHKITARLKEKLGVFVTLHKNKQLRGCIGYIRGTMPLYQAVIENALNASFRDPRFEPLTEDELESVEIEISVLTPMERIEAIEDIEIGKHGLYLKSGYNSGLLLPQVAVEWGWNSHQFLEQTSIKAGMEKNAWKNSEIYTFTAQIFDESLLA